MSFPRDLFIIAMHGGPTPDAEAKVAVAIGVLDLCDVALYQSRECTSESRKQVYIA